MLSVYAYNHNINNDNLHTIAVEREKEENEKKKNCKQKGVKWWWVEKRDTEGGWVVINYNARANHHLVESWMNLFPDCAGSFV